MVFRGTITIEWNGCRQSLEMMVFRWFLGLATIGNDGFRWLFTIGTTMEWLGTIVEVYMVVKKYTGCKIIHFDVLLTALDDFDSKQSLSL